MQLTYLLCTALLCATNAFQGSLRPHYGRCWVPSRLAASQDDEIAKLEEQLKRLKEDKEDTQTENVPAAALDSKGETPIGMFLTESWKEEDSSAEEGGGFTTILLAVGAALVVALFSQIPIGQEDLSKYSVGNSPVAEQIDLGDLNRARRSGDL